jgi:truncated hemoglobin YjbI
MRISPLFKTLAVLASSLPIASLGCSSSNSGTNPADASSPEGSTSTLYTRLGGHAGIRTAVDKIVQQELGDPKIASFFFNQVASPVPAGHPTVDQLSECFTDLLASAAGGTETYPTTVTDEAGTFTCRNLAVIHQPLGISGGTFDTFVMIAATELQALNVSAADIQTIGTVLTGTRSLVVNPNVADAGEMAYSSPSTDGGTPEGGAIADGSTPNDGSVTDGATTTLYERLGGHTGIRSAVDAIVQMELGDPKIASFFFNQVATPVPAGHPTVDQLSECFTDLLASAAGGTETYPMTVTDEAGAFTCRNLAVIHQPLGISGGTFDTFIMIAATELQALNVSAADIQTIGTVLSGTRSSIVNASVADAGEMAYDAGGE